MNCAFIRHLNNKSIIKDYEGIFFSLIYYTNDKDRLNNDQFTTGDYIITLNAILLNKFSFMSTAPWIFFFLAFTLGASCFFLVFTAVVTFVPKVSSYSS